MKRVNLIFALVGFIMMGSLAIPHVLPADCGSSPIDCCIMKNGEPVKVIASTTFAMCWSWKHFNCMPCHGTGELNWFAIWCNGAYEACQGECWGCNPSPSDCCYDKNGKRSGGCG